MLLIVQLLVAIVTLLSVRVDALSSTSFGIRSSLISIRQTTKHHLPSSIASPQSLATTSLTLSSPSSPSSCLYSSSNDDNVDDDTDIISTTTTSIYTPLDRPLLAIVDTISLIIFAAIGKSSHSSDRSLDFLSVLVTAFPFITCWLATSPITAVYTPDNDRKSNVLASVLMKVMGGWLLAVPLGIVMRGVIKGYVPPAPFIVVTLLPTLIILVGVRILFSLVEDFFVEFV